MTHIRFFIRQGLSNMNRNRQRTLFILFSIAVGVAAIVSLRTLGLMIGESLTQNLQASNRGDIVVTVPFTGFLQKDEYDETLLNDSGGSFSVTTFSVEGIERILTWAEENGYEAIRAAREGNPARILVAGQDAVSAIAITYFVDAERYPFYGSTDIIAPPDLTLAEALADRNNIVISERLAQAIGAGVGDELEVPGTDTLRVAGIVADDTEAGLRNFNALILPYALLRYDLGVEKFNSLADTIYIKLPPGSDVSAVGDDLKETFKGVITLTTEDLRAQNSLVTDALTQFITSLGLVSLLIGGIGIVNTMLVVVGRRTLEIGVLKTIGLQGNQITLMFLIEALLLGIFGSIAGVLLGLGLVSVIRGIAESALSEPLQFAIFPEAIVMGLTTGILVTLVFGFLPTLSAGRVRPSVVLQPNLAAIPRTGCLVTLLVVIGLSAVIGLLVGQIVGNAVLGLQITYGALIVLGFFALIFRGFVSILTRLPSFGNIYIKLAQRAIGSQPGRTASTLLALVVGMFSLSLILLLTNTLTNVFDDLISIQLGGNVLVMPASSEASREAEALLSELDGIKSVQHSDFYNAEVVAINGDRDMQTILDEASEAAVALEGPIELPPEAFETSVGTFDIYVFILKGFVESFSVGLHSESEANYKVIEGVDITPDSEQSIVLEANNIITGWLGLAVGDTLTLRYDGGEERTVTIAAFFASSGQFGGFFTVDTGVDSTAIGSDDVIPQGFEPSPSEFIVNVESEKINETVVALSGIQGLIVLEASFLSELIKNLLDQITILPLAVAGLALFASSVIIANTVSLAVLERRRQIGIMKAIGLHSNTILRLLLLENGLVGLVGGLIGTGLGAVGILAMDVLSDSPGNFPFLTLAALVLLAVAIALGATLLTAYGASREKPLIVLRNE